MRRRWQQWCPGDGVWVTGMVTCLNCAHQCIAVYHALSERLECPNCHEFDCIGVALPWGAHWHR